MKIGIGTTLLVTALLPACGTSESPDARPAAPVAAEQAAITPGAGTSAGAATSRPALPASAPSALPAAAQLPAESPARASGSGSTPAATQVEATTAPDAAAILDRAEQAYSTVRSLQADFVQDLTVPLLESTQRSRGTMYHRRPDRFLMKFSDPAGDVVVADGRYLWLYYPSSDAKQVIRTTLAEGGSQVDLQREFLSNPTARFNATLDGTESVAGRAARLLTLLPKQASSPYRKIRLWVDEKDALVRRFEITEQSGTVRRLELRNLQANVTLPDRLFTFSPPAGAQVFQQ
jgi:outer membrane lipoprotein carrier protein